MSTSMTTELSALAEIPNMITQARTLVQTAQAAAEVPEAAGATGSFPASAAIVGLGAALVHFFVQTVEALDDDIDAIRDASDRYERNEVEVAQSSDAGTTAVRNFGPDGPRMSGPQPRYQLA